MNCSIRLIRTLCGMKYINNKHLGDFIILFESSNFNEIKEEIMLLLDFRSQFFANGALTEIIMMKLGNNDSSTINNDIDFVVNLKENQ